MGLARVFYRTDGGITVRRVNKKLKAKLIAEKLMQGITDTEFFDVCQNQLSTEVRPRLVGATYDDIEEADLPAYDSSTRPKWKKKLGGGVEIDNTIITDAEKRVAIEKQLDDELAKQNPNPIEALKLQRKLDKREYG